MKTTAKGPETELRWVKCTVHEIQWFVIEVAKGADRDKILEACLESDALYGDPHETATKQCDTEVAGELSPADAKRYTDPIDLVVETTND